ncbi:MAG: LAO/AO transport system kinase [Saprospiraceae bacterium]|jgi:LAO/AO transport system kinase
MAKKENRSINPDAAKRFVKEKKQLISSKVLTEGVLAGDRVLLSKAITYIESENPVHQEIAKELIENCLPYANKALRIGVTGSPGVGKSTFIEVMGKQVLQQGHKLAVLAVDPSSQISHGSILGDKTRMQELAADDRAFIRPSPAGAALGGVAQKTRETIILCEAAGYDTVFVETVGVGQSETTVHAMVDCFLLLLLPGAGDDLQGIKRGIVEMADIVIVNKADEDRIRLANESMSAYKNALHLFPAKESNWVVPVMACSALQSTGIDEIWETINQYKSQTDKNGYFEHNRIRQSKYWLYESINNQLRQLFYKNENIKNRLDQIEREVTTGKISPFRAAEDLIRYFINSSDYD